MRIRKVNTSLRDADNRWVTLTVSPDSIQGTVVIVSTSGSKSIIPVSLYVEQVDDLIEKLTDARDTVITNLTCTCGEFVGRDEYKHNCSRCRHVMCGVCKESSETCDRCNPPEGTYY